MATARLAARLPRRAALGASSSGRIRFASSVTAPVNADPVPTPTPSLPPNVEPIKADPQLDLLGYPRLPNVSRQWRSPYQKWDDPQERMNFGEQVHAEEEMMGMFAPDVHKYTPGLALKYIGIAASLVAGIVVMAYVWQPYRPSAPRAFPYGGLSKELGGFPGMDEAQTGGDGEDED